MQEGRTHDLLHPFSPGWRQACGAVISAIEIARNPWPASMRSPSIMPTRIRGSAMEGSHFLQYMVMFLAAAVVAVALSKRAGLGAVLGYLGAGAAIGPSFLNLAPDMSGANELSELGVILLLFVIGLELSPARLWLM